MSLRERELTALRANTKYRLSGAHELPRPQQPLRSKSKENHRGIIMPHKSSCSSSSSSEESEEELDAEVGQEEVSTDAEKEEEESIAEEVAVEELQEKMGSLNMNSKKKAT